MYGSLLSRWFECFDPSKVLILRSEDLFSGHEFDRISDFLGISRGSLSAPTEAVNANVGSLSTTGRLLKKASRLGYSYGLDRAISAAKSAVPNALVIAKEDESEVLSAEDYSRAAELFTADMELLAQVSNVKPHDWWPDLWA